MRQMMQGVVLHGTGKKALLEGYSSAGKTGTAQKVDPATHAYSHTKYVATFAGFAPVNDPAIVVAVILDSAVGLHQGGQVSAPVFKRITQQVLEYMHTPHDIEFSPRQQMLLATKKVKDQDLVEGSPDHLGETLNVAEAEDASETPVSQPPAPMQATAPSIIPGVVQASMHEQMAASDGKTHAIEATPTSDAGASSSRLPTNGTVVLDVEQGGIVVPSFAGKTVRAAIELAQDSGLDLDAIGSGLARVQMPAPGTHVASGSRVEVRFGR
jgi:cell division protein FtsI (penicillin-binding protein 3)